MIRRNNKGAMEMSVGTIVTIVLLMSVLVLGIFFISKIFTSSNNAIDSIDSQVQTQINQLFSTESRDLVILPSSKSISLKLGQSGSGFAFSIKNDQADKKSHDFNYKVYAVPTFDFKGKCGPSMTSQLANSYIVLSEGTEKNLGYGQTLVSAELVQFDIPKTATPCTIPYKVEVTPDTQATTLSETVYVNIQS